MKMARAFGIEINHADGIRDVIAYPELKAIGPNRKTHGVDAHRNALHDFPRFRINDIDGIARGVGHKHTVMMERDGPEMRTEKRGVPHL